MQSPSAAYIHETDVQAAVYDRLAESELLDELKSIRDTAEAVRAFAKAAKLDLRLQNRATAIKLRTEWRAGAILASLKLRGGDRRSKYRPHQLSLADLNISRAQSKRWQQLAMVPEQTLCDYLAEMDRRCGVATAAGAIRAARCNSVEPWPDFPSPGAEDAAAGERSHFLRQAIFELAGHIGRLNEMLRPICQWDGRALARNERRAICHLMSGIGALTQQLPELFAHDAS